MILKGAIQRGGQRHLYEVCPENIGPTFISPRHSVRATSAGHERQQ